MENSEQPAESQKFLVEKAKNRFELSSLSKKIRSLMNSRHEPSLDPSEVGRATQETLSSFEKQRYVRAAPRLGDLLVDTSRTNTIEYWSSASSSRTSEQQGTVFAEAQRVTISEHDALIQLDQFLQLAEQELVDTKSLHLRQEALQIREGLFYIGEKELEEGTAGIAELWKSYLRKDPRLQLCIPLGVTRTADQRSKKSSEVIYQRVMDHFNVQELAQYQKRIVTDLNKVGRSTKIILLDDWSKSGTQLNNGMARVMMARKAYIDNVEVHLVAASDQQLKNHELQGHIVPTCAYFNAGPELGNPNFKKGPRITGTHSSVDFDFEIPIQQMVQAINELHPDQPVHMPPGTNIIRQYK